MHEMLLQRALRTGMTEAFLTSELSIKVKPHPLFPNLRFFKYDQIESPMSSALVQESRGVILDADNDWHVVSRPFDKFFNHGDALAAIVDWPSARVQEKLDGSLMALYWYAGQWRVASNGTPDGGGQVRGYNGTFAELFWATLAQHGLGTPHDRMKPLTFIFELMTKYNRVVVVHDEPKVKLIGVRARLTGVEQPLWFNNRPHWVDRNDRPYPTVQEFPLQTIEQVEATFASMSPLAQEGYVVVDKDFNRVKVKHPGYIALHHLAGSKSPRGLLQMVRTNETEDALRAFPEWQDEIDDIKRRYELLKFELNLLYNTYSSVESQKEFALAICSKTKLSGALFHKRAGKGTIETFLADYNIKALMEHLGMNDTAVDGEVV